MINQLLKIISDGLYWGLVASVAFAVFTSVFALLQLLIYAVT